jgi:hypothetical protein
MSTCKMARGRNPKSGTTLPDRARQTKMRQTTIYSTACGSHLRCRRGRLKLCHSLCDRRRRHHRHLRGGGGAMFFFHYIQALLRNYTSALQAGCSLARSPARICIVHASVRNGQLGGLAGSYERRRRQNASPPCTVAHEKENKGFAPLTD